MNHRILEQIDSMRTTETIHVLTVNDRYVHFGEQKYYLPLSDRELHWLLNPSEHVFPNRGNGRLYLELEIFYAS